MSRATEGFSASTATLPDSAATIVLLQFNGSGTDDRLLSSVKLRALAMVDRPRNAMVCPDRKSTRLNSSHLGISYAVFCLKKNKPQLTRVGRALAGQDEGLRLVDRDGLERGHLFF